MIVLFFLALAFGAPLAIFTFNGTPYSLDVDNNFVKVVASDGLYIFYRNLSLYQYHPSPVVITGEAVFENRYVIAPAGDKLVFFVPQGQGFKVFTKQSPVLLNSILKHNNNYGFYQDGRKFYVYTLGTNFTTVLNQTTISLGRDSKIVYRKVPWGIFLYRYNKDKLENISLLGRYSVRVLPTGPITFNETHFFVPWYEHLYIFSKDNALTDDIRMPSTVYGATFYQGKLYIHLYNQTYPLEKEIEHPFWKDAKRVSDFWLIEGPNFTYLYKDVPKAKYEFKGNHVVYYKPLNLFYVLDNHSLSVYRASGCFFNKRYYLLYCKPINISGDYFIIKPRVFLENRSLSGDLKEGIEIYPQDLSGKYELRCMVDYGVGDRAMLVRTSEGPLDKLNITFSAFQVYQGELINITIKEDNSPAEAEVWVDGNKRVVNGFISLNLTAGIHNITITKPCYQSYSYQVVIKERSPWGQYVIWFLGAVVVAILGLLAYLKFIKKAI